MIQAGTSVDTINTVTPLGVPFWTKRRFTGAMLI